MHKRMIELNTCMECGQTKKCFKSKFGIHKESGQAMRISRLYAGKLRDERDIWDSVLWCSLCSNCLGPTAHGMYHWILWLLGISFFFSVYGMYILVNTGQDAGLVFLFLGWIPSIIGVTSGFGKLWGHKKGKDAGALWFGYFFGWTQIPTLLILIFYRKIRRIAWADKRLLELYNKVIGFKTDHSWAVYKDTYAAGNGKDLRIIYTLAIAANMIEYYDIISGTEREKLVNRLVSIGSPCVPAIQKVINNLISSDNCSSSHFINAALLCEALGRIGGKEIQEYLASLAEKSSNVSGYCYIQEGANRALSYLQTSAAKEVLLKDERCLICTDPSITERTSNYEQTLKENEAREQAERESAPITEIIHSSQGVMMAEGHYRGCKLVAAIDIELRQVCSLEVQFKNAFVSEDLAYEALGVWRKALAARSYTISHTLVRQGWLTYKPFGATYTVMALSFPGHNIDRCCKNIQGSERIEP